MVSKNIELLKAKAFAKRKLSFPDEKDKTLVVTGILFMLLGYSYLPNSNMTAPIKTSLHATLQYVPLVIFAVLWLLIGVFCIAAAFLKPDIGGWTISPFMPATWGGLYALGWLTGYAHRGWLTAAIFWAVGLYIYRTTKLVDPKTILRGLKP